MAENAPGREDDHASVPVRERARAFVQKHRRQAPYGLLGLVALGVGAVLLVRYLGSFESTDDAQVDGNISSIGSRIAGTVTALYTDDNLRVEPGDVLAELDPADYRVSLDQAEANLAVARSQASGEERTVPITRVTNSTSLSTAQQDVANAQADLGAAQHDLDQSVAKTHEAMANGRIAQIELGRSRHLVDTKAVSQGDFDQHQATADARTAELSGAQAAVESSRRRVDQSRAKLHQALDRLQQVEQNAPRQLEQSTEGSDARAAAASAARAAVEQANLNLSYTRISAPVGGIVGQRSANIGDRLQSAQALLAIVQVDDLWVTANFKETQLRDMHPGQRADVRVDALGKKFRGHVESLPGASGARFSLLPPENATGNYVKVVQRLPVRIRLDPGQATLDRLRPGMSVEPTVWLH